MNSKSLNADLAERIFHNRNLYYNGTPVLSDAAFDLLVDELMELVPDHPAITDIGAPVPDISEWKKVKHSILMSSLDKATSEKEIENWINKIFKSNSSIFIIDKIDGLSLAARYENGKLVSCATRGDGKIGHEIFRNAVKMRGIKQTLPVDFTGTIRGEIVLTKENHKKYFPELANPRNGASGISKRLDGLNCDRLDVYFYQAIGNVDHYSEYLQLQYIEKTLGLQVPTYDAFVGKTTKDLLNFIIEQRKKYVDGFRVSLPYDCDGIVARCNNIEDQNNFGFGSDNKPRAAVAVKFEAEVAITKVISIQTNVGSGGRLVPVATVEPVQLVGTTVQRASLYNFSYIKEIGNDVGAEVMISKRGEIIPAISEVVKSTGTIFHTPSCCPTCAGPVEMQGENLQCISTDT